MGKSMFDVTHAEGAVAQRETHALIEAALAGRRDDMRRVVDGMSEITAKVAALSIAEALAENLVGDRRSPAAAGVYRSGRSGRA